MNDFHWFVLGMCLMGAVIIGIEVVWWWIENKRKKPINVSKTRSHVLGITDTSEVKK
jgi:hypothetical protein